MIYPQQQLDLQNQKNFEFKTNQQNFNDSLNFDARVVANVRQQPNFSAAAVHHKVNSVDRQTPEVRQKAKLYTVPQMQQVLPDV